ncbi:CCA tRNA nucleotidyltransferase [Phaeobacter sp. QD34_3]|uniref:CCA tRNA nucleotidyltransferase n=1 Tax=unclassified Phaeobacter TaxID=2621772 RepID=UPI00237F5C64|nr:MULTISPECIES: CCA tRNA nucleotidyltransferase [unclassified Phaeobacter]MDE4134376.1 CCA tRNA nucleotidyltransferase [Phaeobacter sp. QD34_3]MDE4137709.1 CCA tRNA nucleotidyltransferase [Phaeobacter sp. QD34_24]
MRITEDWLTAPETQAVCAALTAEGAEAFFVGGCVRNALLGAPVSDIDIATDATPEVVLELAKKAGIRAVPTGIDHGTVTLIQGGIPHEVTTFRKDVATDGRRAVVAFATDIAEDAARRDFTVNALYARPDGSIVDPLGGMPDLETRRIRFIGTAEDRIREDYLRSLRYFRFHAWYGDQAAGFDPDALAAIAANLDGLERLSRERVGAELLKLLAAPDPAPAIAVMRQTGVLAQILPGAEDRALAPLLHLEGQAGLASDPIRRLASISAGLDLQDPLRLSKEQARRLDRLYEAASGTKGPGELGYQLGAEQGRDALILRAAFMEQPLAPKALEEAEHGAAQSFPVVAGDLMPGLSGAALGAELKRLKVAWIASGFVLDRAQLLALSGH